MLSLPPESPERDNSISIALMFMLNTRIFQGRNIHFSKDLSAENIQVRRICQYNMLSEDIPVRMIHFSKDIST
jgi:hypothetical protein